MSPALANFLFEAANFLVLAGALGWVLFKPVRNALDAEQSRHDENAKQAAEARAEAEKLNAEARATHKQLDEEIAAERAELIAAAKKDADEIRAEARRAEDANRERLEREADVARRDQTEALAETLGEVASKAVREMLMTLDGPALDEALIRRLCDELRQLNPPKSGALVESARPLSEASRTQLTDVVGEFDERAMPSLGAGARVTTVAGQVDASAVAIARQAAREITSVAGPDDGPS